MAKTTSDLVTRVLRLLGKLAIGQTAEAEQADDIESTYDNVYAELESDNLVTFVKTSIPDKFFDDVVALVAAERAESVSNERYQKIMQKAGGAKLRISSKIAGKWVNPLKKVDY